MVTLFNWKAQRSGASITILGVDETGAERRITRVDFIEVNPDTGSVFAFDDSAGIYQLMTGRPE